MPKDPVTTMDARRIMIPITTISSINVNPLLLFMVHPPR